MARALRIEYAGAVYHVMARGNQGQAVFRDDQDRRRFWETLGEAGAKTGWRIHAYVRMGNHYHLLVETPAGDLVAGMKWLPGVHTQRFNRRHKVFGRLFQGCFNAVVIDSHATGCFEVVASCIHLTPARAGLVRIGKESLKRYRWSSYPRYLSPAGRGPAWLCVARVMAAEGVKAGDRRRYEADMESRVLALGLKEGRQELAAKWRAWRRGWYVGEEGFGE